jgi:hypothetical protein
MTSRPGLLALLLSALLFGGCSTFTKVEVDQVRARGVSPRVVTKLDRGGVLAPADIIELHRRGISDRIVLRQLSAEGVDYLLTKEDVVRMRKAGVSAQVIAAVAEESDRFAGEYGAPNYDVRYGMYSNDPFYGPWSYDPYYYGGDVYGYGYYGSGHHHHRDHDHGGESSLERRVERGPIFSPRRIFR